MNIILPLSLHLTSITSAIADECSHALRDTDLHGAQLFYLLCVCQNPGLSQDGLAQQLGVNGSNVTRQMGALETMGYVRRQRDREDKRRWLVMPTDRAYEMLPRLVDVLSDAQAALTRGMSPEEIELLCELTERMARNAARRRAELEREE